jgi:microsomal dipeptidase-like Zn-dependent dipeptidase
MDLVTFSHKDNARSRERRGYGPADVAGILGGNFQRALTEICSV